MALFSLNNFLIVLLHHHYLWITLFNGEKNIFNGPEAEVDQDEVI